MASMLFPQMKLKQKLDATYMSHSEKVRQDWIDDPLCHDTGTLEGLKGLLERSADLSHLSHGRTVQGLATKLPCPVWFSFGTGERILSHTAAQQPFQRLGST